MKNITVNTSEERLDTFLANTLNVSRAKIQTLIKNGAILLNNAKSKASILLKEDDVISVPESISNAKRIATPMEMAINFIHEDKDIILLNKHPGLVSHPAEGIHDATLADGLLAYTKELADTGNPVRPGLVHRLDKDTEGVMVIVKNTQAYEHLKEQFQQRSVTKKYYAMVKGDVKHDHYTLEHAITRSGGRKLMKVTSDEDPDGKSASTFIRVLHRFGNQTLVEAIPKTGRTHQIRVHLAHLGHPVMGDTMYGSRKSKHEGHLLQAYYLAFTHPKKDIRISVSLPISERFKLTQRIRDTL